MITHYEAKLESWQYPGNLKFQEPLMQIRTILQQKLVDGLAPQRLDIEDQSHRHQGHSGANPEGESHFHIEIVSAAFAGKSKVARQRLVYALLAEELKSRVHALSLSTLTPEEAEADTK